MKKIIEILISRGFFISISVLIQIFFWIGIFTIFNEYSSLLIGFMILISLFCIIQIIIKNIYPENKIAWIVFIAMVPIAGGIFYILFGSHRISKKTKRLYDAVELNLENAIKKITPINKKELNIGHFTRKYKYLTKIANAPAFENTSTKYFKVGEEFHQQLLIELEKATKFIFIESFIIEPGKMWNSIEKILIKKSQEGLDIRVLYDDLGCLMTLPANFKKRLTKYKIKCERFNKMTHLINANFNNRDHRKICIIDGNVGFNGGINLADEYINEKLLFGHWKDTAIMLKGEGVYGLTLMFLSMWNFQTKKIENYEMYKPTIKEKTNGIIQPFADNPLDNESTGESIYMSILNTAKDYVYITSPYLIITREMTVALTSAAKSGIDVRLILPGIADKKFVHFLSSSYYDSLITSGVKIYEYTKGFIHSKMFISDDNLSVIGTINLDYRSLDLHYECATVMYNSSTTKEMKEDFLNTQQECKEITINNIKKNSKFNIFKFIALGILRTFSPLL